MTYPEIEADFVGQWAAILRAKLTELGVDFDPSLPDEKISHIFWNAMRRRIEPRPRQVRLASTFPLPPLAGLAELRHKFEEGGDLNVHLSEQISDADGKFFHDKLLNDWDIHHFHLGKATSPGAFVTRSGYLLFARVTAETAYFVDVLPHRNWSKQDLIRTIHRNWPESIEHFRLVGINGSTITDEQHATLRKKGYGFAVVMDDGSCYASPGGGYTSTGLSVNVLRQSDLCLERLEGYEQRVKENVAEIVEKIGEAGRVAPNPIKLLLEIDEQCDAYAVEPTARVRFRLGPVNRWPEDE